jgi:hypothetical protein
VVAWCDGVVRWRAACVVRGVIGRRHWAALACVVAWCDGQRRRRGVVVRLDVGGVDQGGGVIG